MLNYIERKKSFQTTDYRLLFYIYICYICYICYIFTITNRVGMSILLYDSVQPFLTIDIVYNSIGNQQEEKNHSTNTHTHTHWENIYKDRFRKSCTCKEFLKWSFFISYGKKSQKWWFWGNFLFSIFLVLLNC